MKKILFAIGLIASGFAVNAQSFNIGLGGGIYSSWLVNSNVSDQSDDLDFGVTFSGQVGLNTSYYFKDNLGLSLGVLFTGHNQKYTGTIGDNTFEARTKLRYLDLPLLLRMGGGAKGAYFEFGPQFSILMGAKEDLTSTPVNTYSIGSANIPDYSGKDVKGNFNSGGIAAVVGFGVDIDASENVTITTGLRLGYAFGDITKDLGSADLANAYAFTGELPENNFSIPEYWAHFNNKSAYAYKATNRAFGGLFIGVMYKIPQQGASSVPVPDTK